MFLLPQKSEAGAVNDILTSTDVHKLLHISTVYSTAFTGDAKRAFWVSQSRLVGCVQVEGADGNSEFLSSNGTHHWITAYKCIIEYVYQS